MARTFGCEAKHYELSMQMGEILLNSEVTALQKPFHREGRTPALVRLKPHGAREEREENLRDFKLSFAAVVYPERSRRASSR
jgi:hypothetical protein